MSDFGSRAAEGPQPNLGTAPRGCSTPRRRAVKLQTVPSRVDSEACPRSLRGSGRGAGCTAPVLYGSMPSKLRRARSPLVHDQARFSEGCIPPTRGCRCKGSARGDQLPALTRRHLCRRASTPFPGRMVGDSRPGGSHRHQRAGIKGLNGTLAPPGGRAAGEALGQLQSSTPPDRHPRCLYLGMGTPEDTFFSAILKRRSWRFTVRAPASPPLCFQRCGLSPAPKLTPSAHAPHLQSLAQPRRSGGTPRPVLLLDQAPGPAPAWVRAVPIPSQEAASPCPNPELAMFQLWMGLQPPPASRGFSPHGRTPAGWRVAREVRLASERAGGWHVIVKSKRGRQTEAWHRVGSPRDRNVFISPRRSRAACGGQPCSHSTSTAPMAAHGAGPRERAETTSACVCCHFGSYHLPCHSSSASVDIPPPCPRSAFFRASREKIGNPSEE